MRNGRFPALPLLLLVLALGAGGTREARALDLDPNDLSLELVTSISNPTGIAHAGDERLFLVEQAGRIRIYTAAEGLLPTAFLDIRTIVNDDSGEAGLLSVAFHPDFSLNRTFFVAYTETGNTGDPLDVVLARYKASSTNPNLADPNGVVLLDVPKPFLNHNGGQLQFGPDGYLYMSLGDGGLGGDPNCYAQRGDSLLGKLLRLHVDPDDVTPPFYDIPPDNPFADPNDGIRDEILALGLRNAWRFSFDRSTGDLYIGDVGQGTIEEIDYQPFGSGGGRNYGWKVMEGTSCHSASDPDCPVGTPACFSPVFIPPIHEYANGPTFSDPCAVIGGHVYRGNEIPPLEGAYLFGDYCTAEIHALEQTSPGVFEEVPLLNPPGLLRTFGEDASGEIYVGIDSSIYRLRYDGPTPVPLLRPALRAALLALLGLTAALAARRRPF